MYSFMNTFIGSCLFNVSSVRFDNNHIIGESFWEKLMNTIHVFNFLLKQKFFPEKSAMIRKRNRFNLFIKMKELSLTFLLKFKLYQS